MGNFGRGNSGGGHFGGSRSFGPRPFDRGGNRGDRPMFKAICSNCGDQCEVPFRPTNGKPVYCSNCFEKMGNGGHTDAPKFDRPRMDRPRFEAPRGDQSNGQLEAISAKLDKILKLLEPKEIKKVNLAPVLTVEKETVEKVKTPKIKKAVSPKKK
jgi:CxxC-x17-CxxC domain-containing protein